MPRPIEMLNEHLVRFCLREGTFPRGNLWEATHGQLAYAVVEAFRRTRDIEMIRFFEENSCPDVEILEKLIRDVIVREEDDSLSFCPRTIRILAKMDLPAGREDMPSAGPSDTEADSCMLCFDDNTDVVLRDHGCSFHHECLRALVRISVTAELYFPPRCICGRLLSEEQMAQADRPELLCVYRQREEEFGTEPHLRLYCPDPQCEAFIGPHNPFQGDVPYECPFCCLRVCPECGEADHPGKHCLWEGEEDVWAIMDAHNLVNCPECCQVMARDGGNIINCSCGHRFCYLCGEERDATEHPCPYWGHPDQRVPMARRPGERVPRYQRVVRRRPRAENSIDETPAMMRRGEMMMNVPELRQFLVERGLFFVPDD